MRKNGIESENCRTLAVKPSELCIRNLSEAILFTDLKSKENMNMETLLIINSLLMLTTLYFVRDVHSEFKEMGRSVQTLKEKFAELSAKFQSQIQSIKERLGFEIEKEEKK